MLRAVANQAAYVGAFTFATLPAAASYSGQEAFASDWGANGTRVRSNGTRWLPVNGQAILKRMGTATSGIANTETIATQVLLPINAAQTGDVIRVIASPTKSGATDSLLTSIRMGTAGTVADTVLIGFNAYVMLGAAALGGGILYAFRVLSSTSVQKLGTTGSAASAYGTTSTVAAVAATTGLTDMSANALWVTVTIKSGGVTDTVGMQELTIIHEAG